MSRIFFSLAVFSLILIVAALVLGLGIGDLYAGSEVDDATLHWASVHRMTGVAAALAVVFVDSIVLTYFVGTSRWCKEVGEAYSLDKNWIWESTSLKRRTFPWTLGSMLLVVGMVALGGAADPATGRAGTEDWTDIHRFGSMVGLLLVGYAYVRQAKNISLNHRIVEKILAEVNRIRKEKGLPTKDHDA